jgi:hypothetical protein
MKNVAPSYAQSVMLLTHPLTRCGVTRDRTPQNLVDAQPQARQGLVLDYQTTRHRHLLRQGHLLALECTVSTSCAGVDRDEILSCFLMSEHAPHPNLSLHCHFLCRIAGEHGKHPKYR